MRSTCMAGRQRLEACITKFVFLLLVLLSRTTRCAIPRGHWAKGTGRTRNLKHSWLAWERWVFAAGTIAEGGGSNDGRLWRRRQGEGRVDARRLREGLQGLFPGQGSAAFGGADHQRRLTGGNRVQQRFGEQDIESAPRLS